MLSQFRQYSHLKWMAVCIPLAAFLAGIVLSFAHFHQPVADHSITSVECAKCHFLNGAQKMTACVSLSGFLPVFTTDLRITPPLLSVFDHRVFGWNSRAPPLT